MGKLVKLIESGDGETRHVTYIQEIHPMKTAPVNDELNSGSLPLVLYHINKFNKKYNCSGPPAFECQRVGYQSN